jgi:hypothetical protein
MDAPVRYTWTSDGVNIAAYAIGDGPPLVYIASGSHLEREWQYPKQRLWLERLAAGYKLLRFDHRGNALSDRDAEYSPDDAVRDIEAPVCKEGLVRFAILGQHLYLKVAARNRVEATAYALRHGIVPPV